MVGLIVGHILSRVLETEQLLFASDLVCLGSFRCGPAEPSFGGGQPCSGHTVVFPRRAVWIQHDGRRPFVADPATIPLYNRGQVYWRKAIDARGDAAEWMAFAPEAITGALRELGHAGQDRPEAPFDRMAAMSTGRIYAMQRRMFRAAAQGTAAAPALEESALLLLDQVLRRSGARGIEGPPAVEAVEEARRLINLEGARPHSLSSLARACALTPYRLCREFRRATGMTISAYRTGLRTFAALEALPGARDLTALALDAGFCSHSHFSAAFRRVFETTPSRLRGELLAGDPGHAQAPVPPRADTRPASQCPAE
jgi:AraC family transcriptional regulator